MKRIVSILWLVICAAALGQTRGYYTPQLPRLSSPSSTDLLTIWSGTNLYSITQSALTSSSVSGKLDATNGTAVNLTVTGSFNTSGGTSPLLVDDTNDRVQLRGAGGSSPVNVRANYIRMGADDGAFTLSSITASANKDLNLYSYDYNLNDWGFLRASASSTANTLTLGSGSGSYNRATAIAVRLGTSVSDTVGTQIMSATTSGFTFTVPTTFSGANTTLFVDTANTRVAVNGGGGSMPFNVIGNVTRWGADDGAIGNRTVTSGTDKDFNFAVYTRDNNEFMLFRGIGSTSANTLYLGYGQSGYRQSTRIYFGGGASVSATSASAYGTLDGINGEWGFGSSATQSGSVLTAQSTTKSSIPFPRQSTAQWTAYSQLQGSGVYDTTVNRIGVSDGTTRRYLAETLYSLNTADIGSISAGAEGTTTITVTGAAVGDTVVVSPARFAVGVYVRADVTSANTVTVYVHNGSGAPYDPASTSYRVNVLRY